MRAGRYILVSFCAHSVLLALAYFWGEKHPRTIYVPPVRVTQGEVFVGASLPSAGAPPAPAAPPPPAGSGSAPAAAPEAAAGGPSFGAPDGDAKLNEGITIFYPPMSVRRGEAGRVTIALEISPEGVATDAKVIRSSGFSRLDQEALQVLGGATYSPAVRSGRAVAARKEITVEYRLDGRGEPENIRIVP